MMPNVAAHINWIEKIESNQLICKLYITTIFPWLDASALQATPLRNFIIEPNGKGIIE